MCFCNKKYIYKTPQIIIIIIIIMAIIAGDKIEKNEMGWACGAYG